MSVWSAPLICICLFQTPVPIEQGQESAHFHVLIAGHPVGTTRLVSERGPAGRRQNVTTEIAISRGTQTVRILEESTWDEDPSGFLRALTVRREGMGPERWVDRLGRATHGWVRTRDRNGAVSVDSVVAGRSIPGPTGVEDAFAQPEVPPSVQQIDTDALEPVTYLVGSLGVDTLVLSGGRGATVCRVFSLVDSVRAATELPAKEWRDGRGRLWMMESPATGIALVRSDLARAGEFEGSGSGVPFDATDWITMAAAGTPPPAPPCRCRLIPLDPAGHPDAAPPTRDDDPGQWSSPQEDPEGSWLIAIERPPPVATTEEDRRGWRADPSLAPFLAPTLWIDSADSSVVRFAAESTGGGADSPTEEALRLERAVHHAIRNPNLSTVVTTASQTLRDGSGDCTEHAILLAACCRARGIPARLVIGGVPFEGRLIYHLWTEIYLGRWVQLDATLGTGAPAPCAIALGALRDLDDDTRDLFQKFRRLGQQYRLEFVPDEEVR